MRLAVRLLAGVVALVGAVGVSPASAAQPLSWERLAGPDRYETSAAISREAYPTGADAAVIASGELFADGLSASYLAGQIDGPLLLTRSTDLPPAALAELTRLQVSTIYVMGGPTAVSDGVVDALAQLPTADGSMRVERVFGSDRYATALAAATMFPADTLPLVHGHRTALMASGLAFADALSASAVAAGGGLPLLLTRPEDLPPRVLAALKNLGVTAVVVLGGENAISANVADALRDAGRQVTRLGGASRIETSTLMADWAIDELGFDATQIGLARGDAAGLGADALGGGPFIGALKHPLLLTASPTEPGAALVAWVAERTELTGGFIFGGPVAVEQSLIDQFVRKGDGGGGGGGDVPPTITTTALPDAIAGEAYSATLTSLGGRPPGTWAIVTGTLPDGLTLNASTGAITGTAPRTGTASFTVTYTDGASLSDDQALTLDVIGDWETLTTGDYHTCGIRPDGTAACWGQNSFGQVGDGTITTNGKRSPVAVDETGVTGTRWTSLSAGGFHTCGVRDDGTAWCWGANPFGQLGDGTAGIDSVASPVAVDTTAVSGSSWARVEVGRYHSCGIRDDGTAWCWGRDNFGQLGKGDTVDAPAPAAVVTTGVTGTDWAALALGGNHTCAIRDDGTAWCWGANLDGQLGDGTLIDSQGPVAVTATGLTGDVWTSLTNGERHTCGVRDDGTGWCWGYNSFGQLGGGAATPSTVPVPILTTEVTGNGWTSLDGAGFHSCGLRDDGTAWCWGNNSLAQNGNGTVSGGDISPQGVVTTGLSGSGWASVFAGADHSCGLRDDGTAWCWGSNVVGQLGNAASSAGSAVPVAVDEL